MERFAIADLTVGHLNALVKHVGGEESVRRILRGELSLQHVISVWKSINIGGVSQRALYERILNRFEMDLLAETILQGEELCIHEQVKTTELAILTLEDFSFGPHPIPTWMFLYEDWLAQWSERNPNRLPSGYVLDLVPPEVGPRLREQHSNKAAWDALLIGMKPITHAGEDYVFALKTDHAGRQMLSMADADPETRWLSSSRFVFRLRKV